MNYFYNMDGSGEFVNVFELQLNYARQYANERIPHVKQEKTNDCGIASLKMALKYGLLTY